MIQKGTASTCSIVAVLLVGLLVNIGAAREIWAPTDDTTAIGLALRYVVPDSLINQVAADAGNSASLVEVEDDRTPFIHDRIAGRKVWRVVLRNINLSSRNERVRDLEVLLDPETGSLLNLSSGLDFVDSTVPPLAPASESTEELESTGEHYRIVEGIAPPLSLSEISKMSLNGLPSGVPQMTAQFVYWQKPSRSEALVWIVTVRGLHPARVPMDTENRIPVYERNQKRYVIDALTGKLLGSTNFPHNNPPDQLSDSTKLKQN